MGSNPSDAEFDHRFSFVDVSRGTTKMRSELGNNIQWKKETGPGLKKGDCKQEEIRINLLRVDYMK